LATRFEGIGKTGRGAAWVPAGGEAALQTRPPRCFTSLHQKKQKNPKKHLTYELKKCKI